MIKTDTIRRQPSTHKQWLCVMVAFCCALLATLNAASESEMYIGSQTDPEGGSIAITRNGTVDLVITLDAAELASGINATLQLPQGITFSSIQADSGMVPGGSFTVLGAALPNNQASILIYSDTADFLSTEGTVATITLQASGNAPFGTFPITILDQRERDIKPFQTRTPRGIATLDGKALPNTVVNTHISISQSATFIFPDSSLHDDIRAALIGIGADPGSTVNQGELVGIEFTSYTSNNSGLTNLSGLEYATDLTYLSLETNNITNLEPLASLTNLTTLKLSGNNIRDLSPLANLTNLETLHLSFNEITDLEPLANLTNLTELKLSANQITDIGPLDNLGLLETLHLNDNFVSNLSPLSFLYNLLDLRLEWNQIGDISALSSNESFDSSTTITLEMNPMTAATVCSDIAVLAGFGVTVTHNVAACGANVDVIPDLALETALKDVLILLGANPGATIEASELTGVGLSLLSVDNLGIRSLQGLQFATDLVSITITNNDITDLSPIANLSSLAYLNLNGNRITNINHIGGISNLNTLLLNNNLIGDISPLANLTNLNILSLKNNTIHNISPLEFLTLDKLYLDENQIVDISHIAGMTSLNTLSLAENFIGDIEPILQNAGIANGDVVNIASNPLNAMSYCVSIPELESFNITVIHDNIPCADFIDRFEPDANPDQAKTLEPGRIITTLSLIDILPDVDDVDWTKFTLTQTAEVAIESIAGTLEPKNAQIETTIYPENLSAPIASSSGTILLNLAPGTYYLKTEEVNGLFIGNYAIRVNADYQEPGNDDIATNATPLTIGQPGDIHTLTGGEIIPGVIASFNMEEDPGWILDDEILDGEWEFGNPSGDGGYPYGNPDPAAGATGLNVFGVNLSGNYDDSVGGPFYLTTPAIDCSRAENVTLEFQRWLNTDYNSFVANTVEVSTDGVVWNTLWQNGWSFIQDSSWSLQTFDISNYADHQKTVFIRWGYQVGSTAYPYSGWNIDDVQIKGDIQRLSNDVDWYTFTINNNRYLQFSATTMFGNAKMETFGPDDPNQPFIQHYVSDNDILFFPEMPAGQYWVRVTEYHGDKAYDYRGDIPAYSFFVEGQGNPDQYEDDDTFENATIVNLDPVIAGGLRTLKQTHNFHDVGDEDWCVMVVPEPEIHPIIGLTDLGPRANPVIDVFADDGTTLLATGSGTIIIDFNTQPDELFYIRVRNADPNVFGIGTAYGINGSGGTEIGGSVVGFIYDPNGSPVSGIRLTIPSPDAGNPDIRSTVSAPDGFYFFGNVPLGHHTATYPATCGIDLDVHIFVQSSNEHNVPVHMEGCPAPNPFDVFVNLSIGQNSNENGTQTRPFSKLAPGVNSVSSGGRVHLRGTKTGETFTGQLVINKRMTLLAENINGVSPVRIGQP